MSHATIELDPQGVKHLAERRLMPSRRHGSPARWMVYAAIGLWAALAWPFLSGRIYVADDLGAYHLPVREFYSAALEQGDAFDWMPSLFAGFYLSGEGQAGTYHPLHWLLYRWLPLSAAFGVELLISYPLLWGGVYLLLRSLQMRREAALFGALVFTYSGFNLLHFVHPNAIAIIAHWPWMLWLLRRMIVEPESSHRASRATAALWISVLTASELLLGYPQYVWFGLLLEAAWTVFLVRSAITAQTRYRLVSQIALAKLLGFLAAGIQLLPTLDAFQESTRPAASAEFAATGSLHPLNLLQLVAPYAFQTRVVGQNTRELGLYCGAVPLLLVIWLLTQKAHWGDLRKLILAAFALFAGATWYALGEFGGLYQLQSWLPIVGKFRFPCRAIVLGQFSITALSAIALCLMWQRRDNRHAPVRTLQAVVALSFVVAVAAPLVWPEFTASWPLVWSGPVLLALSAFIVHAALSGRTLAWTALAIFTAVDLGAYGLTHDFYSKTATWEKYTDIQNTPSDQRDRVALDLLPAQGTTPRIGNQIVAAGWPRSDGYAGLEPARRLDFHEINALRIAGVRWIAAPDESWREVPNPLPRASLVSRVIVSADPVHDISTIDPASTALVDEPLALDAGEQGVARVESDRPGRIEIRTQSAGTQLLCTTERWHRGWRAQIDREPANVIRVNGDFLGCVAPGGDHVVTFQFQPDSLQYGKIATILGLSLIGVCWLWQRRMGQVRIR